MTIPDSTAVQEQVKVVVVLVQNHGFHSIGSVRSAAKAKVVHAAAREAGVEVETVLLDVADADACEDVGQELEDVNRALEKIEEDTYGLSDLSGEFIAKGRREAAA